MKRTLDSKVWKTGNGYVITIPQKIIKIMKIRKGEYVEVVIKNGKV